MSPRTFEPTVYQTFTVKTDPEQRRAAAQGAAGRAGRGRARCLPHPPRRRPSRRVRCRPAKRASPTSPASPAPPASPSSASRRPASSSTAATSSRPRPRPTPSSSTSHLVPQASLSGQIADYVKTGGRIGYDPWLHTPAEIRDLDRKARRPRHARRQRQPRRPHLDRPSRRAGHAHRVPRPQPRRQDRRRTSSPISGRSSARTRPTPSSSPCPS